MAFKVINTTEISEAEPLKQELWTKVKNNFDDHESSIDDIEQALASNTTFVKSSLTSMSIPASGRNSLITLPSISSTDDSVIEILLTTGTITNFANSAPGTSVSLNFEILRDAADISESGIGIFQYEMSRFQAYPPNNSITIPASIIRCYDIAPGAGAHTYQLISAGGFGANASLVNVRMFAMNHIRKAKYLA